MESTVKHLTDRIIVKLVYPLSGMLGVLVTFFIHRETNKIFVDSHKTYSGPGGGISKENF